MKNYIDIMCDIGELDSIHELSKIIEYASKRIRILNERKSYTTSTIPINASSCITPEMKWVDNRMNQEFPYNGDIQTII